jgi:hypothetical protein
MVVNGSSRRLATGSLIALMAVTGPAAERAEAQEDGVGLSACAAVANSGQTGFGENRRGSVRRAVQRSDLPAAMKRRLAAGTWSRHPCVEAIERWVNDARGYALWFRSVDGDWPSVPHVDGTWGSRTTQAVKGYQRSHDERQDNPPGTNPIAAATGVADGDTLVHMTVTCNNAAVSALHYRPRGFRCW